MIPHLALFAQAVEKMDWAQMSQNREPCAALLSDGRFCGRHADWLGHQRNLHSYVTLLEQVRRISVAVEALCAAASDVAASAGPSAPSGSVEVPLSRLRALASRLGGGV